MKNYIFGYGSLMESGSRMRTTPNAKYVYPVVISGYRRGWYARVDVPGLTTTFLGCRKSEDDGAEVNGVVYQVTEEELSLTDTRESGYVRTEVAGTALTNLSDLDLSEARIYVYLSDFSETKLAQRLPSRECPIVQSYVDICINGCLEIEANFPGAAAYGFTNKFISETAGWNRWWANDRIYPRRPFIHCPNAYTIDRLLRENLADPTLFDTIYIE